MGRDDKKKDKQFAGIPRSPQRESAPRVTGKKVGETKCDKDRTMNGIAKWILSLEIYFGLRFSFAHVGIDHIKCSKYIRYVCGERRTRKKEIPSKRHYWKVETMGEIE